MIVIIVGPPLDDHKHCDICRVCMKDGLYITYNCPDLLIDQNGRPPDVYPSGPWYACIECAVIIESRNVPSLVERFLSSISYQIPEYDLERHEKEATRLMSSFCDMREKR